MSDLVQRLCIGEHPIELNSGVNRTAEAVKQCMERGYIHIKFTDMIGGTELGVALNTDMTDASQADFQKGNGSVKFVGDLTLDYSRVRCVAEVDLITLAGRGHLERLDA